MIDKTNVRGPSHAGAPQLAARAGRRIELSPLDARANSMRSRFVGTVASRKCAAARRTSVAAQGKLTASEPVWNQCRTVRADGAAVPHAV
ncbi:MAG: hypothetical protein U0807_03490 [Candidatus Binatia bacterium]